MKINQEKCVTCGNCIPYCPVSAIKRENGSVVVSMKECVECNICWRADVCPTDALMPDDLTDKYRAFRNTFSDPLKTHKATNVLGRGTEEMKTNDVTGTFKPGFAGIGVELGRPGTGTYFYDVEKVAMACAEFDADFAAQNPVTTVMEDTNTGKIKDEYLNERTLSAIVEFTLPLDQVTDLFERLKEVSKEVETVFSIDLISKVDDNGELPSLKEAQKVGLTAYKNGKINIGLGRPRFDFDNIKEEF